MFIAFFKSLEFHASLSVAANVFLDALDKRRASTTTTLAATANQRCVL
jgi:hypothetical protein